MSSELAAGKMLELLNEFKRTVQDLAGRAEKLNEDYRTRTVKDRQRCEAAVEEENRALANAQAAADGERQTAQEAARTRYEQRKERIGRAFHSSRERGLREVDNKAGGRKYDLQKRALQAERDRDAALGGAAQRFEEFRTALAAENGNLSMLEQEAQRGFRGYGKFQRLFLLAYEKVEADSSMSHDQMLATMRELLAKAKGDLGKFRGLFLVSLFKARVIWGLAVCCILGLPLLLQQVRGTASLSYVQAAGVAALVGVLVLALRFVAQGKARGVVDSISHGLARAHRLHDLAEGKSAARRQEEQEQAHKDFAGGTRNMDQQLKRAVAEAAEARVSLRMETDERTVRATARLERLNRVQSERLEKEHDERKKRLSESAQEKIRTLTSASEEHRNKLTSDYRAAWQQMEAEWKAKIQPFYSAIDAANERVELLFPPWDQVKDWKPPTQFAHAAKFSGLNVDLEKFCSTLPKDDRLSLGGRSKFSMPLCLGFPEQGSVLFETGATGHDRAIAALNNVILRLLSVSPPGRLNFTIIDPVGLGQNFAGIMHMADYEEQIINSRIWTQSGQIEQKLSDLNEHMEKVIQMYLRNEYATIADYNEQAGVIAEKYHFLVVADFPANFTDVAAKRLMSIAASGARCGVYTLIHWDQRQPLPQDFIPDELRKASISLTAKGNDFLLAGKFQAGAELALDNPPTPEFAIEFVNQLGKASRDSSRVEVPFSHVTPPEAEVWSEDTTTELQVAVGRTGATKLQYLSIGKGTRQHGLVAGKTGSGKSTLFHVIITNLSLWCSPEQVEFYLVDFKKGVEFKCYAARRLPHARVVAIESDREFALSVLQRVDDELKRRGDMFRQLGVQDIAGYKKAGGTEAVPRTLLLIDEFQEYFVEDDKVSQTAQQLLDRIVRQGRAFGIHVLLGSQTLGGAYTVARTTLGQMVIRIALQCNEADAYLIMDDSNPAPRLLSRPGEGIYNDMAGALEGNSPFQVVWLPDEERDACLSKVRTRADQDGADYPGPIVFEGNAPSDVQENQLLRRLLEAPALKPTPAPRIWLGAPNSIKGPTEIVFNRQGGNNLLIVGQQDEATLSILTVGLVSLAAQFPPGGARFILFDGTAPASTQHEHMERTVRAMQHPVTVVKLNDLVEVMRGLAAEMKERSESADSEAAPPVFLFIHNIHKWNKLRYEEELAFASGEAAESNPSVILSNLVSEGTRLGFHVIASCDKYNNVSRFLSRKMQSEFELRVLFQMSANDSASLIDNPKAGMLGLHRALYYNAQEGYLETFRPYALPSAAWVEQAGRNLERLFKETTGATEKARL